jgi:hypothetical protein
MGETHAICGSRISQIGSPELWYENRTSPVSIDESTKPLFSISPHNGIVDRERSSISTVPQREDLSNSISFRRNVGCTQYMQQAARRLPNKRSMLRSTEASSIANCNSVLCSLHSPLRLQIPAACCTIRNIFPAPPLPGDWVNGISNLHRSCEILITFIGGETASTLCPSNVSDQCGEYRVCLTSLATCSGASARHDRVYRKPLSYL